MTEAQAGALCIVIVMTIAINLIKDIILERRRERRSRKRLKDLQYLRDTNQEAANLEQANYELIQDNNRYKTALNFVAQGWNRGNPSFAKYVLDGMSSSEAYKLAQEDRK